MKSGENAKLGARIREERRRLGFNQADFAALAGASRRALVNWEADGAAPTATALVAWANAGADALYMLMARRSPNLSDPADDLSEQELREIERNLLDPLRARRSGENFDEAEGRIIADAKAALIGVLAHDAPAGLREDLVERAKALLDLAENPAKLPLARAAEFAHDHERRDGEKGILQVWLQGWPYQPSDQVLTLLADLSLEYRVPHKTLVELCHEIYKDLTTRSDPLGSVDR